MVPSWSLAARWAETADVVMVFSALIVQWPPCLFRISAVLGSAPLGRLQLNDQAAVLSVARKSNGHVHMVVGRVLGLSVHGLK